MPMLRDLRRSAAGERVEWDEERARGGDRFAAASLEEAQRRFRMHLSGGGTAVATRAGGPPKQIGEFDPEADIVLIPRVSGG